MRRRPVRRPHKAPSRRKPSVKHFINRTWNKLVHPSKCVLGLRIGKCINSVAWALAKRAVGVNWAAAVGGAITGAILVGGEYMCRAMHR